MKPGLRLFVAGHLVAIGAIYGTAVAVGGQWVDGLLPVPRGPSTTATSSLGTAAQVRPVPIPPAANSESAATPIDDARDLVPRRYDIAPPWSVGSDGRVRLADR
jgi:hypothetical protein